MRLRDIAYRLTVLTLLSASLSCTRETAGGATDEGGTGDLVLSIASAPEVLVTKADRTPKEGNAMNLLSIWIVNRESGEILIHEHLLSREGNDTDGSMSPQVGYVYFAPDGKSAQMKFIDIPRGNCTLYAVANFRELEEGVYVVGAKIDDAFKDMLLNETIKSGESPVYDDADGMPCSAVVDFSIGAGENRVSAEMLRCVGRLTIAVRNNIDDSSVFIGEIGLSDNNPSNAYIFAHEGYTIPSVSSDVAFPELEDIVRVDAKTSDPVTVYDTYLYETDPVPGDTDRFTFTLFGAVYRNSVADSDVKIAYRQEYIFSENNTTSYTLDDMFVIRSAASNNYYVGDSDGKLSVRFFSGDTELRHHKGIENYFWKFSGTPSSTITNVATGRQIHLSGDTASLVENGQGTTFTIIKNDVISEVAASNSGIRFRAPDGYSLTINTEEQLIGTNNRNNNLETHWLFRTAEKGAEESIPYFANAEYEIPKVTRSMTYIDEYGVAQDLDHISRNQHIRLNIGIFYNRELCQFEFEVEPWREKESDTTFD